MTEQTSNVGVVIDKIKLDSLVEDRMKNAITEAKGEYRGMGGLKLNLSPMDVRKQILDRADVVCATLSGAGFFVIILLSLILLLILLLLIILFIGSQHILEVAMRLTGFSFDAVIIDEAAQAVEPSTLIPLKFNPKTLVMVGDPCQLQATAFSKYSKDANYAQSLFQRLHLAGYPMHMLAIQYRMHKEISEYPSNAFYNGLLTTAKSVIISGSHCQKFHGSLQFRPVVFHNISYGQQKIDGKSISNIHEVNYIINLYTELERQFSGHNCSIGIITPYRAQQYLLRNHFKKLSLEANAKNKKLCDVEISTIDGFQGREKDIVIFSCVRAPSIGDTKILEAASIRNNKYHSIGFLSEKERLNVAITRSKYALWLIGHADTLCTDNIWENLINFTRLKKYMCTPNRPIIKSETINNINNIKDFKHTNDKKSKKNHNSIYSENIVNNPSQQKQHLITKASSSSVLYRNSNCNNNSSNRNNSNSNNNRYHCSYSSHGQVSEKLLVKDNISRRTPPLPPFSPMFPPPPPLHSATVIKMENNVDKKSYVPPPPPLPPPRRPYQSKWD
jgi:hypothetical protein